MSGKQEIFTEVFILCRMNNVQWYSATWTCYPWLDLPIQQKETKRCSVEHPISHVPTKTVAGRIIVGLTRANNLSLFQTGTIKWTSTCHISKCIHRLHPTTPKNRTFIMLPTSFTCTDSCIVGVNIGPPGSSHHGCHVWKQNAHSGYRF